MALGAAPASVRSLVLRRALRPVIYGLVVGVGGGLALAQIMQSFLYEVQATDPVTFGTVVVLLLGAAGVASWFPARRGTRVDPMITMRAE